MAKHPVANPGPRDVADLIVNNCRLTADLLEAALADPEDAVLAHTCIEVEETLHQMSSSLRTILVGLQVRS